ncbi:unnamed protein product, partial [Iphiclides podalirius]
MVAYGRRSDSCTGRGDACAGNGRHDQNAEWRCRGSVDSLRKRVMELFISVKHCFMWDLKEKTKLWKSLHSCDNLIGYRVLAQGSASGAHMADCELAGARLNSEGGGG